MCVLTAARGLWEFYDARNRIIRTRLLELRFVINLVLMGIGEDREWMISFEVVQVLRKFRD